MIASALRAAGRSVALETTLGHCIDDEALAVASRRTASAAFSEEEARRGVRHAVLEVTSEALARGYARWWRFDIGVFTNFMRDHLSTHRTLKHDL